MAFPLRETRLRSLSLAAVVAVTFFVGASQAQSQATAAPTFSASTTSNTTTLTITDATPGSSIYYATGSRIPTTSSPQYTGPLTIGLPVTFNAIAVAPGHTQSTVASTTYSTILGSTAVIASANPTVVGQSVLFTATVTPAGSSIPAGSLQFYVNGDPLGSPEQLFNGSASISTTKLPESYLSITASYIPASGAPTTIATSPALVEGVYETARQSSYVFFNNAIKSLGSGFAHPYGVAVDANDNVFVADTGNALVKEITAASNYQTVQSLGTTFTTPVGVAVDANDNVFVADTTANSVYELSAASGYLSRSPLSSGFNSPFGVVAAANGDLFIADTGNHAVKWLTQSSGYTASSVIGGTFQYPWGLAVDSSNNLFITDIGAHTVNLSYAGNSPSTSYTSSQALGGQGFFANPYGVAVDANDDLFVTDVGYSAVRELALIDGWSTISLAGNGLQVPIGAAVDTAGNVFVADTFNNLVREISQTGGNFGSVAVGTTAPFVVSMNFFFDQPYTLGNTAILTTVGGGASVDFTDAGTGTCYPDTPYAGISTCTIDVRFTPQVAATRTASVELFDTSGNLLAAGNIQGIGH